VALLCAAPLWVGLITASFGQDAGRLPPPSGSRIDPMSPAAVDGAVRLDNAMQEEPLPGAATPGENLAGQFNPDAMELRTSGDAANYGKPVIRKPGQKPPKKLPYPTLPTLTPYRTSAEARRAAKQDIAVSPSDPNYIAPAPSTASLPQPPAKARPKVEDEPYAPVGVDLGLLRVKPYVESDIGFNDNPNQASHGSSELRGSAFAREEIGLATASDWNNHSFTGDLRLGYNDYFRTHEADAPDGQGKFLARIDVARDFKINIDGKFGLTTQTSSSPNINNNGLPTVLASRPIVAVFGAGLGVSKTFNRLELTLRGSAERDYWQDARFADGSIQALSRDSYNDYGLTARAAYELTPGVKPYVETTVDSRVHDFVIDSSGYDRNSDGVSGRGGSTFELTRLLTGDIAAGYADRHYADARLADLRGPTFDSSLVWTATALTKVTLRGSTTLDEATIARSPGAVTRITSLELAHALMRNVTLTATGSVQTSRYENVGLSQTTYIAGLTAEYNLTRSIVLKGSFTRQRMASNQPGTDYTADVFMLGLRFQR
jgi:hypothetical protein